MNLGLIFIFFILLLEVLGVRKIDIYLFILLLEVLGVREFTMHAIHKSPKG